MFEAELIGLNRLNVGGVVYQKGVRTPVSREAALSLAKKPRFRVYGLTSEEMSAYHDEQVRPRGPDLREAIRDAIGSLELVDPENYNRDGKPALAALSSFLGYQVTAAQRDAALANDDFARKSSQGLRFEDVPSLLPGDVRVSKHILAEVGERFAGGADLLDVLDSRGALAAIFGDRPPATIVAPVPVDFEWPFAVLHVQV